MFHLPDVADSQRILDAISDAGLISIAECGGVERWERAG